MFAVAGDDCCGCGDMNGQHPPAAGDRVDCQGVVEIDASGRVDHHRCPVPLPRTARGGSAAGCGLRVVRGHGHCRPFAATPMGMLVRRASVIVTALPLSVRDSLGAGIHRRAGLRVRRQFDGSGW